MDLIASAILGAALAATVLIVATVAVFAGRRLLDAIPLADRIGRRRHTAVILRALAAAVEAGQPLPGTLATLGACHPRPWVRKRLIWSAERVARGESWSDALRRAGLMSRADAVLLGAAERVGNLPWAMRETADGGERRWTYRALAFGQVAQTLAVVAMGALVLLVAITYFGPLIALIEVMSGRIS